MIKNFSASVVLKEGVRPAFCKGRPVSYALLEKQGVISPVQRSQWVVVPKNGGSGVSLCEAIA